MFINFIMQDSCARTLSEKFGSLLWGLQKDSCAFVCVCVLDMLIMEQNGGKAREGCRKGGGAEGGGNMQNVVCTMHAYTYTATSRAQPKWVTDRCANAVCVIYSHVPHIMRSPFKGKTVTKVQIRISLMYVWVLSIWSPQRCTVNPVQLSLVSWTSVHPSPITFCFPNLWQICNSSIVNESSMVFCSNPKLSWRRKQARRTAHLVKIQWRSA